MKRQMRNEVTLEGRLGADPQYGKTKGGKFILSFSLATDDSYLRNNEWVRKTVWHEVKLFGSVAEAALARRYRQGELVAVKGKSVPYEWEKEGTKHRGHSIHCRSVTRLSSRAKARLM